MPINTTHKDYDARIDQWSRANDTAEGSDQIKRKTTQYLPRLRDQKQEDYDAYLKRALFYGATGRTIQGLLGAIFRKSISVNVSDQFLSLLDDVTLDGQTINDFARSVEKEILTSGRIGILIDVGEEESSRAYASMYVATSITNWKEERVNGKKVLTQVVLKEIYMEINADDEYEQEEKDQYRELRLDGGIYFQRLWKKVGGEDKWIIDDEIVPRRNGLTLDFIPFVFINAYSRSCETEKPPLDDLIQVNLSHFRSSADLEHGAHFTALPTPYACGFQTETELYIGSSKAWISEDPSSKVGYLEYTGQGLQAIRDLMKDKQELMAVLGARLLEEPKRAVEAAETHKMRRSGEEGSLLAIVGTTSSGLTQSLQWLLWWSGASEDQVAKVEIELNRDFVNTLIDPRFLAEIMKARQMGEISQDTFLFNLQRGELFQPGKTIEDEKDAIEQDIETDMPMNVAG